MKPRCVGFLVLTLVLILSCPKVYAEALAQTQNKTTEDVVREVLSKTAGEVGWPTNVFVYTQPVLDAGSTISTGRVLTGTQYGVSRIGGDADVDKIYLSVTTKDNAKHFIDFWDENSRRRTTFHGYDAVILKRGEKICEAGGVIGAILDALRQFVVWLGRLLDKPVDPTEICAEASGSIKWRCNNLVFGVYSPHEDEDDDSWRVAEILYRNVEEAGLCEALMLNGTITDGHGNPMPYLNLTLTYEGQQYAGVTALDGSYAFMIENLILDEENPKEARLKVVFSYIRGGKTYLRMIDQTSSSGDMINGRFVEFQKTFKLRTAEDLRQDIDFDLSPDPSISSTVPVEDLKHFAPIYFHLHEALDFALLKLKAKVDYKLPVDIWVGGTGTYYNSESGFIHIGETDAHYDDSDRPDNREYHEFAHHIMAAEYNGFHPYPTHEVNHGGYINPSTLDSYVEGFAEFMAMVTSEYHDDPAPHLYAGFGSFEMNYKPWTWRGKDEEIAVAGILWDLYDKNNEEGDSVTLTLDEMWAILKVKRKDFFEYYKAFRSAHPDKKKEIDQIFIKHGFYADKTVGNKKRDSFEPYRDDNNSSGYDVGDYFVDYGMPPAGILRFAFPYWMSYDEGEEVGRAANYHRENRSMAVRIPNAFIKVTDTEIRRYRVYVHYQDPKEGVDYDYGVDVREGVIYLMPPPEDVNVTITVKPDSQDYVASDVYVITTQEYIKKYYETPEDKGYFDEHTFNLKPTGKHADKPYETFRDSEPSYKSSGPEFRDDVKSNMDGGDGGGCCCLPLLPAAVALVLSILVGVPYMMWHTYDKKRK